MPCDKWVMVDASPAAAPAPSSPFALSVLVATIGVVCLLGGCAGTSGTAGTLPVAAGGSAFLSCDEHDLDQMIGDETLLATVAADLLEHNYAQLIADLIVRVGANAVGCAVLAVDTVDGAGATGSSGSGSGSAQPRSIASREARATELIAKYGWRHVPSAEDK